MLESLVTILILSSDAEYDCPKNFDSLVIGSMHFHGNWDEVFFVDPQALDASEAYKAALATSVRHRLYGDGLQVGIDDWLESQMLVVLVCDLNG